MLTDKTALSLIHATDECNICTGNFDKCFVDLAKGKITTFSGSCVATLEDKIAIVDGEELCVTLIVTSYHLVQCALSVPVIAIC